MKMKMKMETRTKWIVPNGGGAPLLTMPNIPHPLHGVAPRTIVGSKRWDEMRKVCYAEHNDTCEICGQQLAAHRGKDFPLHHCHEAYDYDYVERTLTFKRLVCLCPKCHTGVIHSGRAITCFKNHTPLWDKEVMLDIARHGFEIVHNWNKLHEDKLKMFSTILSWLEEPSLHDELQTMIDEYAIEFYTVPPTDTHEDWGKWKLIYNDTDYWSPYQSTDQWAEAMGAKDDDKNNLFDGDVFAELRKNIGI